MIVWQIVLKHWGISPSIERESLSTNVSFRSDSCIICAAKFGSPFSFCTSFAAVSLWMLPLLGKGHVHMHARIYIFITIYSTHYPLIYIKYNEIFTQHFSPSLSISIQIRAVFGPSLDSHILWLGAWRRTETWPAREFPHRILRHRLPGGRGVILETSVRSEKKPCWTPKWYGSGWVIIILFFLGDCLTNM